MGRLNKKPAQAGFVIKGSQLTGQQCTHVLALHLNRKRNPKLCQLRCNHIATTSGFRCCLSRRFQCGRAFGRQGQYKSRFLGSFSSNFFITCDEFGVCNRLVHKISIFESVPIVA